MRSFTALTLFVSISTAQAALNLLQSANYGFWEPGRGSQGCVDALSTDNGASVVIKWCTNTPIAQWDYSLFTGSANSGPQQLKFNGGNKCLDVTGGVNADGTKLQLWDCVPQSPNQQWISRPDFTFQWAGTNKCIDLTDGAATSGTPLQIWTCDSNNWNQKWENSAQPAPFPPWVGVQLATAGNPSHQGPFCVAASQNSDGARVANEFCGASFTFPAGNATWVIPAPGVSGPIKTFDGTKCLDVRDGDGSNGNGLQVWSCVEGNTNQLWTIGQTGITNVQGSRLISWAGAGGNKCVRAQGTYQAGDDLQIWDCDPQSFNQYWALR